ncbi:6-hydroxymethylpterin diphosphokinase MptE-like protein [Colwellia sp. E2M01]|uniref:motility associated factor glycosyltransferase family protein n=1 Tax=Colwellia sp. E2M01 TaxID=2841561 RepID=UPI001C0A1590|nr:6-hydroxymethylpterin diphosphokinase MptE-like protein [Colwellia sp. E2M01]MBU2869973.1 DUF115 domain-containing protein [Colwellia sp. E2M01]
MKEPNTSSNNLSDQINTFEKTLTKIKSHFSSLQEEENALQALADNMSLLASSDEDLIIRYQDNLSAFKEYHPEIFEFFENYTPTKYIVDASDGFVNALDVETGEMFYTYPSFLSTKLQFDKFSVSPNIKKFNFNAEEGNEANFIHVDYVDAMLGLLPSKAEDQKSVLNSNNLSSLILFGVGAGYHIELFAQHYDVSCLYIIEPDLDLFFLSLFSINWAFVLTTFDKKGSQVHISLGEQKDSFFDDLMQKSAFNGRYQMAHVAGYIHYQSAAISALLTEFNLRYLEMGQGWGFFDDAVMSIAHTIENIEHQVPIIRKDAVHSSDLLEYPVFIVGNGPSLDSLIDVIKAQQNKAIVISCGTALSALYQYGIIPDFHCEQERTFPVAEKVEHCCPIETLEEMVLLAPTTVHPAVFSMFKRSIMAPKANEPSSSLLLRDEIGKDLFSAYHFINPTVANTALVMGYNLGFKNFYLMGIDLGHKKGGNHHSKKSLYYSEDEQDLDLYRINNDSLVELDGNFGGKFLCDSFFNQSNANLRKQILGFDDLHCFNLSDGSLIKGSVPTTIASFNEIFACKPIIDKKKLTKTSLDKKLYADEGQLLARLTTDLDFQYFDEVCENLLTLNSRKVESFKEASVLLLNNTILLNTLTEHVHALLQGTVMHIQVVLTQILYSSKTEAAAIDNFNKGLNFYCQFIKHAAVYYRENAEKAHYIEDSKWIVKLRNKS